MGTLVCEHVKSKDVTLLLLYGSWVAVLLPLPAQATSHMTEWVKSSTSLVNETLLIRICF